MTTFVYFDLGNVLVHFDHGIACESIAALSGNHPDDVRRAVFESDLQQRYETGLVDAEEFYDEYCERTQTRPNASEFYIASAAIFEPNVRVLPVVRQLASWGVPLGVLSNTCVAHWDYCWKRYAFLRECFHQYVLSYEAKSMKPERSIYEIAVREAGLDPDQVFFVDDRSENVAGAAAFGIDAVLYTTSSQLQRDIGIRNGIGNEVSL